MQVTEKDVAYVAGLANLDLTPDERARMVRDLNSILGYVEMLGELDTTHVEPMAQVSDRYGIDEKPTASDDGIVVRLPDTVSESEVDTPPGAELFVFDADEIDPIVTAGAGDRTRPSMRHPVTFSKTPASYPLAPPDLDEQGDEIRAWLATEEG